MVVHVKDNLSEFLGETVISARFDNWLYYYIKLTCPEARIFDVVGSSNLRDFIFHELSQLRVSPIEIIEQRKERLLEESSFEWFEDSKRFYEFFSRINTIEKVVDRNPLGLSFRDRCVAYFDAVPFVTGRQSKLDVLFQVKKKWVSLKAGLEPFDWMLGSEEGLRSEILGKVIENELGLPRLDFAYTAEEVFVLADRKRITRLEAEALVKRARDKYAQKNYREKRDKVQVNVLMDPKTKNRLESISKKYGISNARVIDILVNSEFEKNEYISGRLVAWMDGRDRLEGDSD